MLSQNLDNIRLVVKTTIINELTTVRNPNNMVLLGIAFNHSPEVSSKVGCVFLFNPLYLPSRKIDTGHICSMLPDKTGVLPPGNCLSDSLLFSVFLVHTWLLECFHNPLNYGMDPVFSMCIWFFPSHVYPHRYHSLWSPPKTYGRVCTESDSGETFGWVCSLGCDDHPSIWWPCMITLNLAFKSKCFHSALSSVLTKRVINTGNKFAWSDLSRDEIPDGLGDLRKMQLFF